MTGSVKAAERVLALAEPIIEAILTDEGLELVEVTYRREPTGWVLRIFIDRPGGVTISDCQDVSRQVGDVLEGKDIMRHAYGLEVSSPGLNRPLKKERDFVRFAGEQVRIKTRSAVQGRKNFLGRLVGCEDATVQLEIAGERMQLPLSVISKAHIEYDFSRKQ